MNIQKLKEEAELAVQRQTGLINAMAVRKEEEARAAIEKEIPLAVATDDKLLAQEVAAEDGEVKEAMQKSSAAAEAALAELKDKSAAAIALTAKRKVRDVEKEAETSAKAISEHSVKLQAEAEALGKEAQGAATYSKEAADNANIWVKELPVKEASAAVAVAQHSEAISVRIRRKFEDVKRIAKLAGNLALSTINLSKQAIAQADKAKKEATLTVEQAAQNALLLTTIREQTIKATKTATTVVATAQEQGAR